MLNKKFVIKEKSLLEIYYKVIIIKKSITELF